MKLPSLRKLPEIARLQDLSKLLQGLPTLHDLPPWLLLEPTEHERERPQPTLALGRAPFAGKGFCARSQEVPDALRRAVAESCPRCGVGGGMGTPGIEASGNGEAACILQTLDLDLGAVDAERTTEALREVVGRLEPRLV